MDKVSDKQLLFLLDYYVYESMDGVSVNPDMNIILAVLGQLNYSDDALSVIVGNYIDDDELIFNEKVVLDKKHILESGKESNRYEDAINLLKNIHGKEKHLYKVYEDKFE